MVRNHMHTATDHELIHSAQSGDLKAFDLLMQRYDRRIFSLAASYVHTSDDAKDIYQEVFIRVYKGLPKFEVRSEFSTWLYRITTNVCLSHRSRAKRHQHVSLSGDGQDDDGSSHGAMAIATENVQRTVEEADIQGHIRNALSILSPRQRLVFLLKHYEGFKVREIAQMISLSDGSVKKYLFEATQRLRTVLSPYYR
jgi:RNA polymerase sigma-70 factor (ECF subfamily)